MQALIEHCGFTNTGTTTADPIILPDPTLPPAAQEVQKLFRLKPDSLSALVERGYETMDDIALLSQADDFPSNLDFIWLERDRLAISSYLKKNKDKNVLIVQPSSSTPSQVTPLLPPISLPPTTTPASISLQSSDMRNEILHIRKEKLLSDSSKDARSDINSTRQHRKKRSRSSSRSSSSSSDGSRSRSRSRSRRGRRLGEYYDRDRSRSGSRKKTRLSKRGYNLPRPHHTVRPESLKGKDKRAKPENLTGMEFVYGNVDTSLRLSKLVEGKHAPALRELLEYTGYQVRNLQTYKESTVLLFDDEFRRMAKRDKLALSDQSERERLSHFHLSASSKRFFATSTTPSTSQHRPPHSTSTKPACFKFNNDQCYRPNCNYLHVCSHCGDSKHKAYNCSKPPCSASSGNDSK